MTEKDWEERIQKIFDEMEAIPDVELLRRAYRKLEKELEKAETYEEFLKNEDFLHIDEDSETKSLYMEWLDGTKSGLRDFCSNKEQARELLEYEKNMLDDMEKMLKMLKAVNVVTGQELSRIPEELPSE